MSCVFVSVIHVGRYFACSTHALAVNVFGKRAVNMENSRTSFMYYVNDGIYGSFNCIMFDHYTVSPSLLEEVSILPKLYTPVTHCLTIDITKFNEF